jgi:hypothetical protein
VSNLSDLLPAGASGKTIEATATATITSKAPVILNSAGTVSPISETSDATGTPVVYQANGTTWNQATFDSSNNKVVVSYNVGGTGALVAVGTVSGTAISYGTPVAISGAGNSYGAITYDSSNNKVVIAYRDYSNSDYGTAVVGTVSGTSISFGTPVVFESANSPYISCTFDSNENKVVISYRDGGDADKGTAIVGTVSGTAISFGSPVVYSTDISVNSTVFDSSSNKIVIAYRHNGSSNYGTGIVGTVSGTAISFGTPTVFEAADTSPISASFDSSANKVVIAYSDAGNSYYGTAIVGTVSGTAISFGTAVVFATTDTSEYNSCAFDPSANKCVIAYQDDATYDYGNLVVGTVSGTTISFGSPILFHNDQVTYIGSVYDSNENKVVIVYSDGGNSNYGTGFVFSVGFSNVTSFVGIADAGIATSATGTIVVQGGTVSDYPVLPASNSAGTPVVFETAAADKMMATFDSNENKVVIAYQDVGNSDHGTSVVGTVSGTSVSYGTPVVFEAAATSHIAITFDSNSNKVVIAYRDEGNSNYGTAIVGTVSGTSISYGSPVVFRSANSYRTGATFDSSNNKVVIAYTDGSMNAIVGTVSGTSISFGTEVEFDSASTAAITAVTFDSSANKVVIGWQDSGNLSRGTAIVGTVSGTAISFGTEVVFEAADIYYPAATFDSNSNKVVFAYYDGGNSNYGTAIVGTVSGTAISFGTAVVFETAQSSWNSATFDSNTNNVVIAYRDVGNSNYGTAIDGTVSGTSISFGTALVFEADTAAEFAATFDSNSNKVFIAYEDQGNSNYGTGVVYTSKGSPLTIGSKYYVQNDGTITTVSSSVNAGLATSTTQLLLNGDS